MESPNPKKNHKTERESFVYSGPPQPPPRPHNLPPGGNAGRVKNNSSNTRRIDKYGNIKDSTKKQGGIAYLARQRLRRG